MTTGKTKDTRNAIQTFVIGFIGANLVAILGNVIATMVYMRWIPNRSQAIEMAASNSALQTGIYVAMELFLFLVLYGIVKKVEKQSFTLSELGLPRMKRRWKFVWTGVGLVLVLKIVAIGCLHGLGQLHWKGFGLSLFPQTAVLGYFVISLISYIVPGFFEEIFFRGYIQNRLLRTHGPVFSITLSSIFFALIHIGRYFSILPMLYVFCMGILLGYLYYMTKSLYLSMGFHFTWDFTNSWIDSTHTPALFIADVQENALSIVYIVIVLLVLITCMVWKKQRSSKTKENFNESITA